VALYAGAVRPCWSSSRTRSTCGGAGRPG